MVPARPPLKRLLAAVGVLALLSGGAFLAFQWVTSQRRLPLWHFTENEVTVEIDLLEHPSGRMELSGTFTPGREGYHLYSKDLPRSGLKGLGRPTLLEITASEGVEPAGPLAADQPVKNIYMETLGLSFPVYPDGPVTLSLPIERTGSDFPASMEVSVTYMMCSDQTCLPPVVDKRIQVKLPDESFEQK